MVSNIVNGITASGYQLGINTQPLFVVPAGQPDVTITGNIGNTGGSAPIPAAAQSVATGGDQPFILFQPSSDSLWEFWGLDYSSGAWSTQNAGYMSGLSNSKGVFDNGNGVSASGISYGGIMVTQNDIASGAINHTVGIYLSSSESTQFWPPATNHDGGATNVIGQVAEGMWFRFPPSMSMPSGLNPLSQMLFTAIQNYGCVIHDRAYGSYIPFESHGSWALNGMTGTDPFTQIENGQPDYSVIGSLPLASLVQIIPPILGNPPQAAPTAPVLSVTSGSNSLNLSWQAITSPTVALFYLVQYRVSGTTNWTPTYPYPTTNAAIITGLNSSASYDVQVLVANADSVASSGTLVASNIATASTT
jgi:hypothetical protein